MNAAVSQVKFTQSPFQNIKKRYNYERKTMFEKLCLLPRSVRRVLNYFLSLSKSFKDIWSSQGRIASNLGYCRQTVNEAIAILADIGFLDSRRRGVRGWSHEDQCWLTNTYKVSYLFFEDFMREKLAPLLPALKNGLTASDETSQPDPTLLIEKDNYKVLDSLTSIVSHTTKIVLQGECEGESPLVDLPKAEAPDILSLTLKELKKFTDRTPKGLKTNRTYSVDFERKRAEYIEGNRARLYGNRQPTALGSMKSSLVLQHFRGNSPQAFTDVSKETKD